MRRGEILRLQWSDLDLEHGYVKLRDPKGGVDQTLPLSSDALNVFLTHPKTSSRFVFPDNKGNQRTQINHQANRIKRRAGLPSDVRPLHGLRHTMASLLVSNGVDLYTIQKLLCHKSPVMTQRYSHLRPEVLKKAIDLAGDLINQTMDFQQQKNVVNFNDSKRNL